MSVSLLGFLLANVGETTIRTRCADLGGKPVDNVFTVKVELTHPELGARVTLSSDEPGVPPVIFEVAR